MEQAGLSRSNQAEQGSIQSKVAAVEKPRSVFVGAGERIAQATGRMETIIIHHRRRMDVLTGETPVDSRADQEETAIMGDVDGLFRIIQDLDDMVGRLESETGRLVAITGE